MSQNELYEHQQYLADEQKLAKYREALAEVITPGDVVLDLGAGTGLLGYLACEAGAGSVIALERGDIIDVARRIAAANGYADRITHVQALSTEAILSVAPDVVVCDQIGGLVYDAGILAFYADARKRLLGPRSRLVPSSFTIKLAPVEFETGRKAVEFWSSRPGSIDVEPFRALAANTEWHYNVSAEELSRLAPGQVIASFAADHDGAIKGSAEFAVEEAGSLDGFIGWFEAQLSPSVTLTNDPWSPDRFKRWCNFYPLEHAPTVGPGDRVRLGLDIRPRLSLASWSTTVRYQDGRTTNTRQSTLHGVFLTSATVDGLATDQPIPPASRDDLIRLVLDLIDGTRSQRDIVAQLSDRVGTDFASRVHLENFVQRVVKLTAGSKPR